MKWKTIFASLWILAFSANANTDAVNTIQVSGKGDILVSPDAYTVTLVIEERGESVNKLNIQMNAKLNSVVGFLRSIGIKDSQIQSMAVNLMPWYEHTPTGRQDKGFVLTRQVRVTAKNLKSYDKLLDGVTRRGINRIERFAFTQSDPQSAYQAALTAAVKDAKTRAELLARQLGVKITGVVSVVEMSSPYQPPVTSRMSVMEADNFSLPGESEVKASVTVTFAIDN